jgi:DNA-binding LacI/PurR family transcriptional regulator
MIMMYNSRDAFVHREAAHSVVRGRRMTEATIGVISIGQDPGFFAGRYFREILTVASQQVAGHGCFLRIVPFSHEQGNTPDSARAMLDSHGINAALFIAPSEACLTALCELFQALPSMIISAPHLDVPFNYVNSDNYGAMREIVAHLAGLGRRRIRLLQPYGALTGDYWERARGYADAVDALGIERSIGGIPHPINEAVIDAQVLVGAPDALIAPSDQDALALLSRLQRRGHRIPADLALVGFDDEDFAAETLPALTTVSQPLSEMASRATQYLLDRLDGVERGRYQDVLPNRLIVRESCGA